MELGADAVRRFLSYLAVNERVSASTQNQALAALLFLYRDVLRDPFPGVEGIVRAKRPERLPVVLSRDEVAAVLARIDGTPRRVAMLLYGGGLRLLEALTLRVKDVHFGRGQLVVRSGEGRERPCHHAPHGMGVPKRASCHTFALRSLRTCWKTGMTSARYRSFWDTST